MGVKDVDRGWVVGYGIVFHMGKRSGLEIGAAYYTSYQLRFFIL